MSALLLDLADVHAAIGDDIAPERLPDWDRAVSVLPVFSPCRALFSTSPADTALKLVVLLALSKAEGRFSKARIRALVPHLDPDKLDRLVDSLYGGGWLQLRATDDTYRLVPVAFFLLNLLVASDFAGQSPANLLVRAVETVAFGDRIDRESTGHLLAMLLAELETQAEHAREILARGTPRQLIRFSRQEVRAQLAHVGQVLSAIEERTAASSEHFGRLVRLHEAIQQILRAHEGLGRRLAEWSLKRLETSEAGYSLTALSDAVLGSTDEDMLALLRQRAVVPTPPAVGLVTRRLLTRHRTTRPSLAQERAAFEYTPPPEPEVGEVTLAEVDPVQRVRERLLAALERDGDLTEALLEDSRDFADAVYQLSLLARLEGHDTGEGIELVPGVRLLLEVARAQPDELRGLHAGEALALLLQRGVLVRAEAGGLHPRLEVRT